MVFVPNHELTDDRNFVVPFFLLLSILLQSTLMLRLCIVYMHIWAEKLCFISVKTFRNTQVFAVNANLLVFTFIPNISWWVRLKYFIVDITTQQNRSHLPSWGTTHTKTIVTYRRRANAEQLNEYFSTKNYDNVMRCNVMWCNEIFYIVYCIYMYL